MIEQDILKALQTAGIAAIDATVIDPDAPLPIKAIARTLDPIPEKYFEFVNITNNSMGMYYGSERVYQGIFRILLHWQIEGDQGAYPPMTLLGKVADYFTKGRHLVSGSADVVIYDEPDAGSVITSGAELIYPLSMRYRCFRP